jgi:hypothetical protein
MAARLDAGLQDAEAVLDQFAYYALQGNPRTGSHSSSASAMIFMPARDSLMRAKSLSSTASPTPPERCQRPVVFSEKHPGYCASVRELANDARNSVDLWWKPYGRGNHRCAPHSHGGTLEPELLSAQRECQASDSAHGFCHGWPSVRVA